MKTFVLVAVLVGSMSAAAAAAPVGWKIPSGTKSLVHTETGLAFPPTWNGMIRLEPRTFDSGGHNVSIGYSGTENHITLTFYVYPADFGGIPDPEEHFKSVMQNVLQVHADAQVERSAQMQLPLGNAMVPGYNGFIHWSASEGEIGSFLILIPQEGRFLKVRVSFEMDRDPKAIKKAGDCLFAFLRTLQLKR